MRKTLQYEKLGRTKPNGVGILHDISNKIQYKVQFKQSPFLAFRVLKN